MVVDRRPGSASIRIERGGEGRTEILARPLPAGRDDIASELAHHLDTAEPIHESLDEAYNLEVMAILDAGVRSAEGGAQVTVAPPLT